MTTPVQTLIERAGGMRRVALLAVAVATVAVILGLSRWASAPEWVPAYTGVPLETAGKMTDKLDQAGIQYRLEAGGTTLTVPAEQLARARVVLASAGLPETGRPGMELFDQPSWGMTDFTQRINFRRALEGELERTIGRMRGVAAAQVHLALPPGTSFRQQTTPAEASVVLRLADGLTPPADVVQGIAHLVASSVEGLDAEHVTIVDDAGRMLSEAADPDTPFALTNKQLALQREVETSLEARAQQLVEQVVGAGNARVQVSAQLNFDKVERTVQSVDPQKQVASTEQRAEIVPGTGGGAGSTNTATSYENSHSLETFSGAVGTVRRLSVAVLVNDTAGNAAAAGDSGALRSAADLARIDTLVRSALGVDSTRGDMLSVVGIPFARRVAPPAAAEPRPDVWTRVREVQRPATSLAGVLASLVVALLVVRALRPPRPAVTRAAPRTLPRPEPTAQLISAPREQQPAPAPEPLVPVTSAMRQRVATSVDEHPEVAAKLARAWMKES